MRKSDQGKRPAGGGVVQYDSLHDEIVLWLYGHLKKMDAFTRLVTPFVEAQEFYEYKKNSDVRKCRIPAVALQDLTVKLEHPIKQMSYRGAEIKGYFDILAHVDLVAPLDRYHQDGTVTREITKLDHLFVACEVKSSVNVGETIRQIEYYRTLDFGQRRVIWLVCAPPCGHEKVFEEHGIKFVPYKPRNNE